MLASPPYDVDTSELRSIDTSLKIIIIHFLLFYGPLKIKQVKPPPSHLPARPTRHLIERLKHRYQLLHERTSLKVLAWAQKRKGSADGPQFLGGCHHGGHKMAQITWTSYRDAQVPNLASNTLEYLRVFAKKKVDRWTNRNILPVLEHPIYSGILQVRKSATQF